MKNVTDNAEIPLQDQGQHKFYCPQGAICFPASKEQMERKVQIQLREHS